MCAPRVGIKHHERRQNFFELGKRKVFRSPDGEETEILRPTHLPWVSILLTRMPIIGLTPHQGAYHGKTASHSG